MIFLSFRMPWLILVHVKKVNLSLRYIYLSFHSFCPKIHFKKESDLQMKISMEEYFTKVSKIKLRIFKKLEWKSARQTNKRFLEYNRSSTCANTYSSLQIILHTIWLSQLSQLMDGDFWQSSCITYLTTLFYPIFFFFWFFFIGWGKKSAHPTPPPTQSSFTRARIWVDREGP